MRNGLSTGATPIGDSTLNRSVRACGQCSRAECGRPFTPCRSPPGDCRAGLRLELNHSPAACGDRMPRGFLLVVAPANAVPLIRTTCGLAAPARSQLTEAGAIGFYEQSLAVAGKLGDRRGAGLALGNLGAAWYALGDAKKAVGYFGEDLAISRELGDLRGEGPAPLTSAWRGRPSEIRGRPSGSTKSNWPSAGSSATGAVRARRSTTWPPRGAN